VTPLTVSSDGYPFTLVTVPSKSTRLEPATIIMMMTMLMMMMLMMMMMTI
jgi:hypothetical protein